MRRKWIFGLVTAVILLAGGIAATFIATAGNPRSAARPSTLAIDKFGSAQQARLQRGLVAPSLTAQSAVLAVEIRAQFLEKGQSLLPAGSRARIDATTFKISSPTTAVVDASIDGSHPQRWQLLLIKENGSWLLIGTRGLG